MQEIYIISYKDTGYIKSTGRVNRERDLEWINNGDTSTALGSIERQVRDDENLQVLFLANGDLPDRNKQKVNAGNTGMISKSINDLADEEKAIMIKNKEAEIANLQAIIAAPGKLLTVQNELTALTAEPKQL